MASADGAMARTLAKLRGVARDCLDKHLVDSAVFFADKLVSASDGDADDVYLYCEALFAGKHHRRALTAMRREGLLASPNGGVVPDARERAPDPAQSLRFRHLAARCLAATKEWDECLAVLGDGESDAAEEAAAAAAAGREGDGEPSPARVSLASSMCLLRGRAHEALENRPLARDWYKSALLADPFCREALDALVGNHMLTAAEERDLMDALPFAPEDEWLRFLYGAAGKKYHEPGDAAGGFEGEETMAGPGGEAASTRAKIPSSLAALEEIRGGGAGASAGEASSARLPPQLLALRDNGEVALAQAEWLYQRGNFQRCHDVLAELLRRDPFQLAALPCYLAVSVELQKKNELFMVAHELTEEYPDRAVSWFAVACYYYCVRRFDEARRYFSKATALEGAFVPAWIGFGHSFAAQDESDQAMAAYRTAARLFPGCHLPVLCIGMEYQRTNHLGLAEQFFEKARDVCPADPLVHNELGVLAYRNRDHAAAVKHFERALSLVPHPLSDEWEATVVNLAHANRKRNDFDAAIEWYERALSLAPRAASTYTALGFTHQLKGNFQSHMSEAIECYHKALGLRPDDTFAQEMLTLALIDQCAVTMPPYEFVPYDPYGPPPERFSGGGERGFRGAEGARGVELDEEEGRGDEGAFIPEAEVVDEDDEDDDMEMSP